MKVSPSSTLSAHISLAHHAKETPAQNAKLIWDYREAFLQVLQHILLNTGQSYWMIFLLNKAGEDIEIFTSPCLPKSLQNKLRSVDTLFLKRLLECEKEEAMLTLKALKLPRGEIVPFEEADFHRGACLVFGEQLSPPQRQYLENCLPALFRLYIQTRRLKQLQTNERNWQAMLRALRETKVEWETERLCRHILHYVRDWLNAPIASLCLADRETRQLIHRFMQDSQRELVHETFVLEEDSIIARCLSTGSTIVYSPAPLDSNETFLLDAAPQEGITSAMDTALIAAGEALGVLQAFASNPNAFGQTEVHYFSLIASVAAQSLRAGFLLQESILEQAQLEASEWVRNNALDPLRALLDHFPFSMYIIAPDFRLVAVSQNRAQEMGMSSQSIVGQCCYLALHGREAPCVDCHAQEVFYTARHVCFTLQREKKSPDSLPREIYAYPILNDAQQATHALIIEIDEEHNEDRRVMSVLAQTERLATLGQIAANVAHEINNPLTAILANAQLLQQALPQEEDLQESVDLILRAGARATQIIRSLLDYARIEKPQFHPVDVNKSIQEALDLLRHEIVRRDVQLEFRSHPHLPPVLSSQDQLQSVWVNLILNALDALDRSPGKVFISTYASAGNVIVIIADNGKGIHEEELERIFEPFYTTKALGKGTGLGLSICRRIVQQHGGSIRVESRPGVGSKFMVQLPIASTPSPIEENRA